jgi:amidase
MTDDLSRMDATAQAALVHSGAASPLELVDASIAAIEKLNPELNAVIHPLFDRARAEAAGPLPDGPFRGVPFLLKDLAAELDGAPFCEGSAFAGDYVSTGDQELTARFRAAGFVVCGKTNTPEFGILPTTEPVRFGATRNPWDPTRTTGGSSGGSAAAVASGMVPVAHANDGGGSIRIPASACGLVGLKPTRGRVSLAPRYGDVTGGLVCEHVVSRSVRDSAAILDATSGPVPGDPYAAPAPRFGTFAEAVGRTPERLRIALLVDAPTGSAVHPDCVAAARAAAQQCESLGHEVVEPVLALDGDRVLEHFINVWAAGNAWTLLDWEERIGRSATPDDVEVLTWALVEMGRALDAGHYLKSVEELQRMARQIAGFYDDHQLDLLLTPTLAQPPLPLGSFDPTPDNPLNGLFVAGDFVPFTPVFNATGQPAISLPLIANADGLPLGVQFVARLGDEETLLSLAGQLEQAMPWADRVPQIHA